jgi:hypothetical protein
MKNLMSKTHSSNLEKSGVTRPDVTHKRYYNNLWYDGQ